MSAATATYFDVISRLPEDSTVIFNSLTWDDYLELSEQVGETHRLRLSFNEGTLQIMSLSTTHEKYVDFIKRLMSQLSVRLRLNILFFGSATMRNRKAEKGNEPDACFYVQNAAAIGHRLELDFTVDPPPDVVVEVDIHHDSTNNDPFYAVLGVSEIWRYDGQAMQILLLHGDTYEAAATSRALPMITAAVLTEYLERLRRDGEFAAVLAFDEWLQTLPQ